MARMIDAVQVLHNINLHHRPTPVSEFESGFNDGLNQAMWEITHAPTLIQPNEGAKDKNVPTNDPLTLEEVSLMIEPTPVWWDWVQGWVLARKGMIISWNGVYYNFGEVKGNFYRRPPEGENDVVEVTENL